MHTYHTLAFIRNKVDCHPTPPAGLPIGSIPKAPEYASVNPIKSKKYQTGTTATVGAGDSYRGTGFQPVRCGGVRRGEVR